MTDQLQKTPANGYIPKANFRPYVLANDNPWSSLNDWIDPPELLLGKKRAARYVSMDQKLEMWSDELISFLMSYLATLLVGGEYEIICRDPRQRKFFQALYEEIHQDLMLKAAPAMFFGYQGCVKRFHFRMPAPLSAEDTEIPWEGLSEPLILRDVLQIHPSRASVFRGDDGSFKGIAVDGLSDPIPVLYSLWFTVGGWRAFGDDMGYGRAVTCFDPWYKKYFTMDQRTLYVQTGVAPPVVVYFPSGEQDDGTTNQSIAQIMATNVQAAASVAMPSDVYQNGSEFERQHTNIKQWDIQYLINTANPGPFNEIKADEDKRIAMGMLVPPQTVIESQQMGLGGPNTAEIMSELAERVLAADAYSFDNQINNHLFPFLVEANFGPDAPPVYKKTKGLNAITRAHLQTVFSQLLGVPENATIIDARTIANRLNVPTFSEAQVAQKEAVIEARRIADEERQAENARREAEAAASAEGAPPPREVLSPLESQPPTGNPVQ